ncbi:MAG: hypothetical protein ABH825_04015 [Candidatus Omnitrophota bacterium]
MLVAGLVCFAAPVFCQEDEVVQEETDIVAGKISAVDAQKASVTVTEEAGDVYTLTISEEETSIWRGDDTISLADLKMGETVELEYYTNEAGQKIAIWIDVLIEDMIAAPEEAIEE